MTLEPTDQVGPLSPEQESFYQSLSGVTSLETSAVNVGLVESSPEVMVGSYALGQIDVDDMVPFGDGPVVSSAGTLIHEITEQASKQQEGKPYPSAHSNGVSHENKANGSERVSVTGSLSSTSLKQNEASYNYQRNGTMTGNLDLQYNVQGKPRKVSIMLRNNNVKRVIQ